MPKELDETCNFNIITLVKNNAFVDNTRHFDSEIDLACSESSESATLHFPALGEVVTVLAREHADCTDVKVKSGHFCHVSCTHAVRE